VEAAGHDEDPAGELVERPADLGGHEVLPAAVHVPGCAVEEAEVAAEGVAALEVVLGRERAVDLEHLVPEGVEVVHAELFAEGGDIGPPAHLGVGVAVAEPVAPRDLGPGEVDEPHRGTESAPDLERLPLGRVDAERVIRPATHTVVQMHVAVNRDRQVVAEVKLLDPVVEVGRALDEDGVRLDPLGQLHDHPGAGRAVVPDGHEDDPRFGVGRRARGVHSNRLRAS
jgi:hypothetical protein